MPLSSTIVNAVIRERPFSPFTMRMRSGRLIDVADAEHIMPAHNRETLVVYSPAQRTHQIIDIAFVDAIEFLPLPRKRVRKAS